MSHPQRAPWYSCDYPSDCQYNSPGCDMSPLATSVHDSPASQQAVRLTSKWISLVKGTSQQIDLSDIGITDEDVPEIVQLVGSRSDLSELNLCGNRIDDYGVNLLCQFLVMDCRNVNRVDLRGNQFGETGRCQIQGLMLLHDGLTVLY